jgi:hypothetical protein
MAPPVTDRSTEEQVLRRIHGNGKGWAFSEYIASERLPRLCSIFAVCPQVTAAIDTRDAQAIEVAYDLHRLAQSRVKNSAA